MRRGVDFEESSRPYKSGERKQGGGGGAHKSDGGGGGAHKRDEGGEFEESSLSVQYIALFNMYMIYTTFHLNTQ